MESNNLKQFLNDCINVLSNTKRLIGMRFVLSKEYGLQKLDKIDKLFDF